MSRANVRTFADLAVGHRVAEAAVHRFVGAVVERLRQKTWPP